MDFLCKMKLYLFIPVMLGIAVDGIRAPNLTILKGDCGQVTSLICESPDIVIGKPYHWYIGDRKKTSIYDNTKEGKLVNKMYVGTIERGRLELQIHNTSVTHSNVYSCNYDYRDSNKVTLTVACRPHLTISAAGRGGIATLTCTSQNIATGDSYKFYKYGPNNKNTIYDNTDMVHGKYNGTIGNGRIVLQIYNISDSDAANYSCSHNHLESDRVLLHVTSSKQASGYNSHKLQINIVALTSTLYLAVSAS